MVTRPFSAGIEQGILTLVLDTPASDCNILSVDAASQILEILGSTDPSGVRAVLFRSAKQGSFVNGVGLMMAGMAQTPEDAPRVSEIVRGAYRAIREFPAPTIAVIQGNCYGCGVELSLQCDYRFAADTYDTHFYMTEVADYLFIPLFGGTQDLPRLLGLPAATDFLLWGERWSAREAAQRGLIDGCFDAARLEEEVARRLPELDAKRRPRAARRWTPELDAHVELVAARIATLPPMYQGVYRECFDLMTLAARKERLEEQDYAREIAACGRSAVQPASKAAISFFFVRQLAQHASLRGYELPPETRVVIPGGHALLDELRADLVARRVTGVEVLKAPPLPVPPLPSTLTLTRHGSALPGDVDVALEPLAPPFHRRRMMLYAPLRGAEIRLVEIACDAEPDARARALYAVLHRAGFVPIFSRPGRSLATNDICAAFLAPLVAFVLGGRSPADVHATLRDFGFARPASALVRALRVPIDVDASGVRALGEPGPLARVLEDVVTGSPSLPRIQAALDAIDTSTFERGAFDEDLLDAVLASLFETALRAQDDRVLVHPSYIDLMAREILDFPLGRGSLCRYVTGEVAARMVARRDRFAHLVPAQGVARSERFVSSKRSFYQARRSSGGG